MCLNVNSKDNDSSVEAKGNNLTEGFNLEQV
ncbi:hypothetical protein HNQ90_000856 [Algibacter amylolyticus]|nr:hypothetical protein [Algibacter amylolyticus]